MIVSFSHILSHVVLHFAMILGFERPRLAEKAGCPSPLSPPPHSPLGHREKRAIIRLQERCYGKMKLNNSILCRLVRLGSSQVAIQRPPAPERWLLLLFGPSFGMILFWVYDGSGVSSGPMVADARSTACASPSGRLGSPEDGTGGELAEAGKRAGLSGLSLTGRGQRALMGRTGGPGDLGADLGAGTRLPKDAVILFEPLQGEAIAGWFAAPLWSF